MKKSLVILAAGLFLAGCGDNPPPKTAGTTNTTSSSDYLGTLMQAKKYADKTIDVSFLNQAVQEFNVQEGHFPKTLEELTPNYIPKIPEAPAGCKIDYDPATGEVKVVRQ
jgi:outer membrane PBP1 activator LpoA protein